MGYEVRRLTGLTAGLFLVCGGVAQAQESGPTASSSVAGPAVGIDVFASSDADDTEVLKVGIDADWRYSGPDDYVGVRLETTAFRPLGEAGVDDRRLYLRFARSADWSWKGQVGSDGQTILGGVSVHNGERFRQEYFVEREIVETARGVDEGLYYTFVGGAFDLPMNDRTTLSAVVGLQAFTGDNVRTHVRANIVQVLKEDWGLSAQLRTRYFQNSHPGEYDYFSPEWHAELMPVLQIRRRRAGWRYVIAGGVGAQRTAGATWRSARYFNAQVVGPTIARSWALTGAFTYSNTPISSGYTYAYSQVNLGLRRIF